MAQWRATADFLSERIDGFHFTMAPYKKLKDLAEAAHRGDLDFVITNPSSYVEMELNSGARRMLTLVNEREGEPYTQFGSVIFTRAERSDIKTFEDLRGKSLTAVSKRAFGGWRVAWVELLKQGIDPKEDLKKLSFAGSQHKVVYAIRDGKADVGVVRTDMLERMAGSGLINLQDFRSVGQRDSVDFPFMRSTDLYPEWAFAKFSKAPEGLSRKIVNELFSLSPDSEAATKGKYVGWTVPLNYQPVHELLKTLRVGPYTDFGKVNLADALNTYRYWIAAIVAVLLALIVTGAFALSRSRQLAGLREDMLEFKDRELDFRRLALDEHAIVSMTDVKGDIIYANDRFCDISGFSRDELLGQNHNILKSGEHSAEFFNDLWRTITNGNSWHGEIKNKKKDAGYYWVMATIVPFMNDQGKPFQYVGIRTDITDRKEREREALNSQREAEKANRVKSEFLSSMSHELRTPMNAILGFAQMLELNPEEPLSEKQKQSVSHILKGGMHLLELIDQVLDLAKIESGKLTLSLEPVRLEDVCLECLSLIEQHAASRSLNVIRDFKAGGSHTIMADYTRFKQVLLNLLSNAVKYNRDGGSVTLACRPGSGETIRISVADTGEGLSTSDQAHLFEPFNRLGKESGEIEGTGIGLTITRQLVETMGGLVGFESEAGKGSTFWVEMPSVEDTSQEATAQAHSYQADSLEDMSTTGGTVLYIEDNPANMQLMESIIDRIDGLTLIVAENAELGLKIAEEKQPNLILMDINLPGLDGIEATRILGARDRTRNIPVVAISASAMKRDVERGMAAGFKAYLTKPFDVKEVIESIEKYISV